MAPSTSRKAILAVLAVLVLLAPVGHVAAHEGEDHGSESGDERDTPAPVAGLVVAAFAAAAAARRRDGS